MTPTLEYEDDNTVWNQFLADFFDGLCHNHVILIPGPNDTYLTLRGPNPDLTELVNSGNYYH